MRLLVLDHFFDQDIAALRDAAAPDDELRVLPYEPLRTEALRVFPPEVARGLEPYARPELEDHRRRWAALLERYLEEEFSAWPFDALVLPSDLFFYVRAAPAACHRLGAPLLVVQKETTISPNTMIEHADRVRRYAPPLAYRMTVCSERQRDFWLNAGGEPDRIEVVGQPRFDLYAAQAETGGERGDDPPKVLFFSYHVDAYHPSTGSRKPVWEALHRQTEEGLWELARAGWRVLVKPHPQQDFSAERRRIRSRAGQLPIELVSPGGDARGLIAGADVVIGFQTTALLEAMAAAKPVLYTGWDPEAARLRDELVPFADWGDVIHVIESADALAPTAREALGWRPDDSQRSRRSELVEGFLGPIDGHASERTLAVVRRTVEEWAAGRSPDVRRHRELAAARRAPLRLRRRAGQRLRELRRFAGALLGR